ncbi:hypothetical protein C8J57DRAFT_1732755 [Mycena rebaudengoi]|nr:hypothetical protein C8J57DRAFT_1732755 [Mycena rebaudengoi]
MFVNFSASRILTTPPLLSPQSVCITPSLKLPGGHRGHHRLHSRSSQCAARLWQSTLLSSRDPTPANVHSPDVSATCAPLVFSLMLLLSDTGHRGISGAS